MEALRIEKDGGLIRRKGGERKSANVLVGFILRDKFSRSMRKRWFLDDMNGVAVG